MVGEFVAHDDSRLRFGSLNHLPGDAINPQRPIAAYLNTLISLPLLGHSGNGGPATGLVLVAIDPKTTLASIAYRSRETGFSPYQSARVSRYDALT